MTFTRKKLIMLGVGFIFILMVAAISRYYVLQYNQAQSGLTKQETVPQGAPAAVSETDRATGTDALPGLRDQTAVTTPVSTSSAAVTAEPPEETDAFIQAEAPFEFPPFSVQLGSDIDQDQLTDAEEELFGTDSGTWDTDADGYYDGQEVSNLYNPTGFAPVKLIDSGLIREYINSAFDYRIYYPRDWRVGEVDPVGKHVLFSGVSGDYVELRVSDDPQGIFRSWFARHAAGQKITDLLQLSNRFNVEGWKRRDDMVAYFSAGSNVYVLIYHPAEPAGPALYKHAMTMMTQSFRPSKSAQQLPDQPVLPGAAQTSPTSTTDDSLQ